jgi:hypothetical protein
MKAALKDHQRFIFYSVHQAVFLGDASRPPAFEIALEGFRLSDSFEWVTQCISDQFVNFLKRFTILFLPVKIIGPSAREPR